MKKYFALIAAILSLCILALGVCSCGGGTPADSKPQTSEPATSAPAAESIPTESAPVADAKITYTVTVKNDKGAPIEGVIVKICEGESCKKPNITDADGKATFSFVPNGDELKAMIEVESQQDQAFLDAYTYSSEYVYLEEGATEITLTVTSK